MRDAVMKGARALTIATLAMFGIAAQSLAGSDTVGMIVPNTREAAEVLDALRKAEHIDKMDAEGYSSIDVDKGMFYYLKARQIDAMIKRLQSGQSVSRDDVDWVLDNGNVSRF
jgi:hypothetical protein